MAKDAIDNGNNINAADVVENQYLPAASQPTSYPTYQGDGAVDGDKTTDGGSLAYVDLKEVHALSQLVFHVSEDVDDFRVYTSTSDTDSYDSVNFSENITSECTLDTSAGTITCTPTTRYICRWYKIQVYDPSIMPT